MIVDRMTVPSSVVLGATCRRLKKLVRMRLQWRMLQMFRPFVTSTENLFYALRCFKAVVSGSAVLHFMVPSDYWSPRDLDIFTPRCQGKFIVALFIMEGYTVLRRIVSNHPHRVTSGIMSVTTLTRDNRFIDVVEASTRSPIFTISRFHLTALMNFISADGFFSAYPRLTESHVAVANGVYRTMSTMPSVSSAANEKLLACFLKYMTRGYRVYASRHKSMKLPEFTLPSHICRISTSCPHTLRHSSDRGCLYYSVFNSGSAMEGSSPILKGVPGGDVAWHIGGPLCTEGSQHKVLRHFCVPIWIVYIALSSIFISFKWLLHEKYSQSNDTLCCRSFGFSLC